MIPITLSILGATAAKSRRQAFLVSASYVGGIVLTYTLLGMLCAKTGMIFGSLLSSPAVIIGLCIFLAVLSLHTLEIFQLPLAGLQSKASNIAGKGYFGAFIMGLVSGAVAAPCVGPVLVLILVEAARSNSTLWGTSLLLAYSLGLGLPFLILGTFSNLLKKLPRSGNWMLGVKYLIALGLLLTALFFLQTLDLSVFELVQQSIPSFVWIVLAIAFAGWAFISTRSKLKPQQLASAFALALCVFFITHTGDTIADASQLKVSWEENHLNALALGQQKNKPIVLDLHSKWCMACKELDHSFADPQVAAELAKKFVASRVDFTRTTAKTEEISKKYNVLGLPCVLFLRPDGTEIEGSRITGEVAPKELAQHLSQTLNKF